MPLLFRLLDDSDWDVRFKAARTISVIDPKNPELVARLLHQLRSDPNSNVRREAAKTLCQIGENTDQVINALTRAAQVDEGHVQLEAVRTLWRLTGEPELVLDGIRSVFNTRWANDALELVRDMGPAARPLVPNLLKFYERTSGRTERQRVADLIRGLDADSAVENLD